MVCDFVVAPASKHEHLLLACRIPTEPSSLDIATVNVWSTTRDTMGRTERNNTSRVPFEDCANTLMGLEIAVYIYRATGDIHLRFRVN